MHSRNYNESGRRAFSSVICQWHTLRSLEVIDLTQEALKHLATIPSLQRLSFTSLKGATRSCDQRLPIGTRNPVGGYPAPRSLSISYSTTEVAIAFAQLLSSSPVEDLHISVVYHCYPPQWRELFSTISHHIGHASLQNFSLKELKTHMDHESNLANLEDESDLANLEVGLEALAVFSNLQNVVVQPILGIMLTSDTANRLAAAWPHIQRLELGDLGVSSKSPIITIEDLKYSLREILSETVVLGNSFRCSGYSINIADAKSQDLQQHFDLSIRRRLSHWMPSPGCGFSFRSIPRHQFNHFNPWLGGACWRGDWQRKDVGRGGAPPQNI